MLFFEGVYLKDEHNIFSADSGSYAQNPCLHGSSSQRVMREEERGGDKERFIYICRVVNGLVHVRLSW